jgi:hypothetical protein
MIPVLILTPERLRARQHIGLPVIFDDFEMMVTWGSRVTWIDPTGDDNADKASAGGIALGTYDGGHRTKKAWRSGRAMTLDLDEDGDVDRIADAIGCSCFVHETYRSKPGALRCRVYIELAEAVTDVAVYDLAHAIVRRHLASAGEIVDEGAKDSSRLNYVPVREYGTGYRFRRVEGPPLDVVRMLAAQPPPPPRSAPRLVPLPENRDRYVSAALARARTNVASATPGGRHLALCRESYSLARLALTEAEIADALLPAFVAASGESRRHEGKCAVRDAVHARGRIS